MIDGGPGGLVHVAQSIQARGLRGFRWDEHRAAVLLNHASPEHALALAEAWRGELDGTSIDGGRTFPAFSLGVAHAAHGASIEIQFMSRATNSARSRSSSGRSRAAPG